MTIELVPGLEIEVEYPADTLSVEAEVPPFVTDSEVDAILVQGPEGPVGPQGPAGSDELEVDPVLLFENALA